MVQIVLTMTDFQLTLATLLLCVAPKNKKSSATDWLSVKTKETAKSAQHKQWPHHHQVQLSCQCAAESTMTFLAWIIPS